MQVEQWLIGGDASRGGHGGPHGGVHTMNEPFCSAV
jgi:hypothetical protein